MFRRVLLLLLAAAVGAGLAYAAAPAGIGDAGAWVFEGGTLAAAAAESLAVQLGDARALRALSLAGVGLSAALLAAALRNAAPDRPLRAAGVGLCALLAAPVITGAQSASPDSACLGAAALALLAWRDRPLLAAGITAAVGAWSAPTGAALAVAGAFQCGSLAPLLLAFLLAGLGRSGPVDVTGLDNFVWVRTPSVPATGVAVLAAALLIPAAPRLRRAALGAAVLAFGPVLSVNGAAIPLPAALLAILGASGGWSGAGVVAVAALALAAVASPAAARHPTPRVVVALTLLGLEGLALASRPLVPYPSSNPAVVRSLAERRGGVLVLPAARLGERQPRRAALWRRLAERFHRPLYRQGEPLTHADPVLGATGVVALFAATEPEQGWVLPSHDDSDVLRTLGITELVLDRRACTADDLARIDPVMARLLGAPQRDIGADVDLWRVDPHGKRSFPTPPYLRRAGDSGTFGWQTLEQFLAVPAGPASPGSNSAPSPG